MIRFKKLPEDINIRLHSLKNYLEESPEVVFAYLFGGFAEKRVSPVSDVDIAVYLKDPERVEYMDLYKDVSEILGTEEFDLVVLNRAPISIAGRVLLKKEVIVDKDPFIRHSYESLTIRKFLDFKEFEERFFRRRLKTG
ncbi:MAG: nucleotidyltransferase domain-containing protein [Nitrospirae bacterium]|nr:MAG: nucleotidyltransferase domain-containing protein [Nitrospirota bacterium]